MPLCNISWYPWNSIQFPFVLASLQRNVYKFLISLTKLNKTNYCHTSLAKHKTSLLVYLEIKRKCLLLRRTLVILFYPNFKTTPVSRIYERKQCPSWRQNNSDLKKQALDECVPQSTNHGRPSRIDNLYFWIFSQDMRNVKLDWM